MIKISRTLSKAAFTGLALLTLATTARAVEFSIVVIPDTQWYAETNPTIIDAQFQWVVDNRISENIIYVAHLGDLKDDVGCDVITLPPSIDPAERTEWEVLDDAVALLEDPATTGLADGIPFGLVPGNHDFDQVGGGCPNYTTERPLTEYDGLFGPARFAGRAYYGGSFPAGSNENTYSLFEFAGIQFIAINLGYRENAVPVPPGDAALAWADGLLAANPDRIGIVTTHFILQEHTAGGPTNYGSYGASVYSELSDNPNLWLMMSAHRRGEAWRIETRAGMDDVHILMSNYQDTIYPTGASPDFGNLTSSQPGDSGFMRIMRFDTDTGLVDVETFAPAIPTYSPPRPTDLVSTEFVTDGNAMDRRTASNFSLPWPVPTQIPNPPILLDTSGSMEWSVDGVIGVPEAERRITYAREAARAFLDMMVAVPENEDQANFGIATFPDHPSSPCSAPNGEVVVPLASANSSSVGAVTVAGGTLDTDPDLDTENSTPLIAGIETAIGMFGADDGNRSIILLSDGYHNCPGIISATDPAVDTLIADLNAAGVRVFTIGFGKPGDVDNLLHRRLANETTPAGGISQFYDVTDDLGYDPASPATWNSVAKPALDAAFKEILSTVMGLETAVDPIGTIAGGATRTFKVPVTPQDDVVTILLSWPTLQQGLLTLDVVDAAGNPITARHRGVTVRHRPSYSLMRVDLDVLGARAAGTWTASVGAPNLPAGQQETFQYSAVLDSNLRMTARLGSNDYAVGDTILLTAALSEGAYPMTGLSDVTVRVSAPDDGLGNWLSQHAVTAQQLEKIPAVRGGEPLQPFQRKGLYLDQIADIPHPARDGGQLVTLVDDGTQGDAVAGDGIYSGRFSATAREGVYSFYFAARGDEHHGYAFQRERLLQTYLPVRPAAEAILVTAIELEPGDLRRIDVRVTPKDQFGNYLGPGHAARLALDVNVGRARGPLRDMLDGSYVQTIEVPRGSNDRDVAVRVGLDGDTVTSTTLAEALKAESGGRKHGWWWLLLLLVIVAAAA